MNTDSQSANSPDKDKKTDPVKEILNNYKGENDKVLANLARLLNSGHLGGTGKMVILPVDQGFEHGPARSFAENAPAYDPTYHFDLAIEAGCNAYAAPYGFLSAGYAEFAEKIPLILKLNGNDSLSPGEPLPALTASVADAVYLGAAAVGFTIYPGSGHAKEMYQQVREIRAEARAHGLPLVIWSYPRGGNLTKDDETAMDVVAYAAHLACQLGAHVVKVKPPTSYISPESKAVYNNLPIWVGFLADRVSHVMQCAFNGKRIVIFSGGPAKDDHAVLNEVREIHKGRGFGSIIGRNAFQRPRAEGVALLQQVMDIYANEKQW